MLTLLLVVQINFCGSLLVCKQLEVLVEFSENITYCGQLSFSFHHNLGAGAIVLTAVTFRSAPMPRAGNLCITDRNQQIRHGPTWTCFAEELVWGEEDMQELTWS